MRQERNSKTKTSEFTIVQKARYLYEYSHNMLHGKKHFPKSETFFMVKDIYELSRTILFSISKANEMNLKVDWQARERIRLQKEAVVACRNLNYMIREAWHYEYIDATSYSYWTDLCTEIIKMIYGWVNSDYQKVGKAKTQAEIDFGSLIQMLVDTSYVAIASDYQGNAAHDIEIQEEAKKQIVEAYKQKAALAKQKREEKRKTKEETEKRQESASSKPSPDSQKDTVSPPQE